MSIYEPTKIEMPKINLAKSKGVFWLLILVVFISSFFGFLAGIISGNYFDFIKKNLSESQIDDQKSEFVEKVIEKETVKEYLPQTTQEEKIINAVKEASPAVVSIVITKNVEQLYFSPFEEIPLQRKIEEMQIGGGTGFIISKEGLILTNKHVVIDESADYTVLTNNGKRFSAKVLARDPVQDLAVIKIEEGDFPTVKLGDSKELQIGQTVIAIGNVLGELQNTVSVGVISGLGRTITAYGGGLYQTLEDVIQTDAAINSGNSGGPLLNLKGEVVGINTAMVFGGENIGFAITIDKAKKGIEQVKTLGKIVYPFLGVRYVLINEKIQKENNLPADYGAWVTGGEQGEPAVFPDSVAEKAGFQEGDIILEFDGEKITTERTLAKIIMERNPGDKVVLKVLRNSKEFLLEIVLGERSE